MIQEPRPKARRMLVLLTAVLSTVLTAVLTGPVAHADPPPAPAPPAANAVNPADPAAQLAEAQRQAAELTEQWHAARDDLTNKRAEVERARAAIEPARLAAADARAAEDRFRVDSDAVIMSALEHGRLDSLSALLVSESPQQFLDQMTVLETMTSEQRTALGQLLTLVRNANQAERDAADATGRAEVAAADAARLQEAIQVRQREAEVKIADAERLISGLTPEQQNARRGPAVAAPVEQVAGRGLGATAMRAATSRMNKPYRWGAEGPNAFDCSGLTYWAFRQVGVTLPRSSGQQALLGRPVSRANLQPGDLVFFYRPISHVGFYAGEGKIFHAVQPGDVVRYSDMDAMPYNTARRL
jgi:cell wall-associated NlpC family hydrolase